MAEIQPRRAMQALDRAHARVAVPSGVWRASGRPPAAPRAAPPSSSRVPAAPSAPPRYMTTQDLDLVRQNLVSRMAYADLMVRKPAQQQQQQQQQAGPAQQQQQQQEQQQTDETQQQQAAGIDHQQEEQQQQRAAAKPADDYHPSQGWRPQPHHLSREQLWQRIRTESKADADAEPTLASFLYSSILAHRTIEQALAFVLANKLASPTLYSTQLKQIAEEVYAKDPGVIDAAMADLQAVLDRDPACDKYTQALLHFKGYQAIQSHRVAHHLWLNGRRALALMLQSRISEAFHVDIHPAARVGRGILLDHATGVVVGETASIGDNVSMLHHVTLGGSGIGKGVRHPQIGHGALLGAGVTVLGPVTLGPGAKVGAGSVVVTDLEPHSVAVGVPARVIKRAAAEPSSDMDQIDFLLDYVI
ncbi:serine O-acetyltransferase [Raphidocelis subcapitata]|uniref:serine O-acetyltransferase n=1 Tax=Raphidocelis subcapitata TaxID=307507 RepID=A0A2V0PCT6_9CHLO|nr:serine O-acetyltransferase [Raphidocelis subcapitata]|eukprot:GBF96762.1 serine O-acetyltransferase [Raphidocelis subcapitata]